MQGTIHLQTERLILRRYRPEDSDILYRELGCDPVMYEYSGWNPYATPQMAKGTTEKFIESYRDPHFYGWVIEADGCPVGTVGAYDYDEKDNAIEIGISIFRDSWGKGYATEAVSCVMHYLIEDEQIAVIRAWCAADNIGSMRAMEKSGMTRVRTEEKALVIGGETYDQYFYELRR